MKCWWGEQKSACLAAYAKRECQCFFLRSTVGGGACAFTKGASWVVACEPVQKGASWVVACAPSQKEHREQWSVYFCKKSIVGGGVCTYTKRAPGWWRVYFCRKSTWVVACALVQKEHHRWWNAAWLLFDVPLARQCSCFISPFNRGHKLHVL